jgi:hypothetical protein
MSASLAEITAQTVETRTLAIPAIQAMSTKMENAQYTAKMVAS